MKGSPQVLEMLNNGLTIELTAINQYFVQARICRNRGYHKLARTLFHHSREEMEHAQMVIDRILFLEGSLAMRLGTMRVGNDVKQMLENDLAVESEAVRFYNQAIDVCNQAKDGGTRELAERIVHDSEEDLSWAEAQLRLIADIGLDNYLAGQVGEEGAGE